MAFLDSGTLGGSLKVGGAFPLDGKLIWDGSLEDLEDTAPIDQCWEGMIVYVTEEKTYYKLETKGIDSSLNVWVIFGKGGGFNGLTGDVVAGEDGVTTVEKLSEAAAVGKNQSVIVLPDGTMQGEDLFELWVYDDTTSPYSLSDLQTNYPTSAGRLQGFEVRCRLLTPPTTYRKESENDSIWIKIEGSNVV